MATITVSGGGKEISFSGAAFPPSMSGCGPCPPVVRVPRGASDVVVTDDGMPAGPRIVEG